MRTQVNPWTWQERFGFSQAWKVDAASSLVFISGQGAISSDGRLAEDAEGDFDAQVRLTFENLKTVLDQAGGSLDNVVKLTVYLTDISRVRDYSRIKAEYMKGEQPASTAVGVNGLAVPGMLLELEAVAAI